MIEYAHAKINLSLDVKCRRPDGYHELESVFLPLALHDTLEIELADANGITCNEPGIPCDESNLIWKAMALIQAKYQRSERFHVTLKKEIPSMAGLGGGSSDAAAMLRAMNQMLGLNLDKSELIGLAKSLGADVPFFLDSKPAIAKGIGEQLNQIAFPFDPVILLVKPLQGVPTKLAYEMLDFTQCDHPDMQSLQNAIAQADYETMVSLLGNSLEYSAFQLVSEIAQVKETMRSMGFDAALMSGSGSTVFGLSRKRDLIDQAEIYFRNQGLLTRITGIKHETTVHIAMKI